MILKRVNLAIHLKNQVTGSDFVRFSFLEEEGYYIPTLTIPNKPDYPIIRANPYP